MNPNCEFYAKHQLNYIMGTTGGDRDKLLKARPSGTAVVTAFVAMGEEAGSCRCAGAARRSQGGEAG